MGGYDLYGRYYSNVNDAINAEMAQCAAIDADMANRKVAELEKKVYEQKQPEFGYEEQLHYISQYIQSLEERIKILESKINNQ